MSAGRSDHKPGGARDTSAGDATAGVPAPGLSRRQLLAAGAVGAAGAIYLRGGPSALAAKAALPPTGPPASGRVPHLGLHQAGVTTPMQRHLQIAAFDLDISGRRELVGLLSAWQNAIALLTGGRALSKVEPLTEAPADTGEAAGQGSANLSITIGFGPSLFDQRFGLGSQRPAALIDLPLFAGDQLDAARSGGDLSIQACADQPLVAEHAVRDLARIAKGAASLRWLQTGFDDPPVVPAGGTGRNLLGFKDGTANLDPTDAARMRSNVWVQPGDGPEWMSGGTYQVYRRVALHIEHWDESILDEQQDTFGRYKASGAPYGAKSEFAPVTTSLLPANSHVRLANPRSGQLSEEERILRRGYSFTDGYDTASGTFDYGLAFIAYQRDPRKQFLTIQQRLSESDALNEYSVHTASGIFAVPPGSRQGGFVGEQLLTST